MGTQTTTPTASATTQARVGARVPVAIRVAYAYANEKTGAAARTTIPDSTLVVPTVSWLIAATTSPSGRARTKLDP